MKSYEIYRKLTQKERIPLDKFIDCTYLEISEDKEFKKKKPQRLIGAFPTINYPFIDVYNKKVCTL